MLVKMITTTPEFQDLPLPKQAIIHKLASLFESDLTSLYLSPHELAEHHEAGTPEQWAELLDHPLTKIYMKKMQTHQAEISQRKGFFQLQQAAARGDLKAIEKLEQITQQNSEDARKIIVLTRINRREIPQV